MAFVPSSRSIRLRKRQFKCHKKRKGNDYDDLCVICLESLSQSRTLIVETVCGHMFHGPCWGEYAQARLPIHEMIEREITDDEWWEYFLNCTAGPPCPSCKQDLPLLHELSGSLQTDDSKGVQTIFPCLRRDLALMVAENKYTTRDRS